MVQTTKTHEHTVIDRFGKKKRPMVERTCERCSTTFLSPRWYVKKGGGRFCSHQCRAISQYGDRDLRLIHNGDGTVSIPLRHGKFAIIDEADAPSVEGFAWSVVGRGHVRNDKLGYLHRHLTNAPDHLSVDHINGDKLDNRRSNLRLATLVENNLNRGAYSRNKSGYKGVHWNKQAGKWEASINKDGERHYLGLFTDPAEAGRAYDKACLKLHGEFAYPNFPEVD